MSEFYGTASFPVPTLGVERFDGGFVGEATFSGTIAVFNRPREEVAAILPRPLELVWNRSADVHPVVFLFGDQARGTTHFGGATFSLEVDYPEACFAIPFVRRSGGRYGHTLIAQMYTPHESAAWSGNRFYGYAKRQATLGWEDGRYVVADEQGQTIVGATLHASDRWSSADDLATPNLNEIRRFFALSILGRKADGELVSSYFHWDFAAAQVRPTVCTLEIASPLAPGGRPDRWTSSEAGAYDVRGMTWLVSWPQPFRA
jgi:hypothetical protein